MEIKDVINPLNTYMKDRKSIRKYDTNIEITKEELGAILRDATTAPSSLNMQPWRFAVIHTPEGKAETRSFMLFNKMQAETASAFIVVYADTKNFDYLEEIYDGAQELKVIQKEGRDKVVGVLSEYRKDISPEKNRDTILYDCGQVSMQIQLAAKAYGFDTNVMGSFMKEEMSRYLGMDSKRYIPVVLIAIGQAAETGSESVRFKVDKITKWI